MKKIAKQVMAVGIAIALAATSVPMSTQTVSAAKKTAAKKAGKKSSKKSSKKSNKKSKNTISLKVGSKKTLKVKGISKKTKIKWKTSKKKVAAVSKKGVVKAKKAGTTKITAKYGKKKKVWTVKVTKKTAKKAGVASVAALDGKTVRVNLTAAKALKASNFVVRKKADGSGQFAYALRVASVTKLSSKVYEVGLATDDNTTYDLNCIEDGDYVQVTVSALPGNKSGQTQYYYTKNAEARYFTGVVGDTIERSVGFTQSHTGYLNSMKITGVPNGLTAKAQGDYFKLEGTLKTAKASIMTLTAKDEKGKKLVQKYSCYIGSSSVMFSYIEAGGRVILANDNSSEYFEVYTVGGSGAYTYTLPSNTNKYISFNSGDIVFDSYRYDDKGDKKLYLPARNYSVAYQVKDTKGHINKGTLAVNAVNGVKVSGRVLAADGTGIDNVSVVASFKNDNNKYYRNACYGYSYSNGDTDSYGNAKMKSGDYNMIVYPSVLYKFYASKNDVRQTVSSKNVGKNGATVNFKLALYKVLLSCGSDDLTCSWYDSDRDYLGYEATFGVGGNRTVKLTKGESSKVYGSLSLDNTASVPANDYMKFIPAETGTYTITMDSSDQEYTSINVYTMDDLITTAFSKSNQIYNSTTNSWVYEKNITMNVALTAGRAYYIQNYCNSDDRTASLTISKEDTAE